MFYRCLHHYWLCWMVVILAIVRLLVLYETILINTALFKSVWVLFTEINTIRNYKDYNFSLFKIKFESWVCRGKTFFLNHFCQKEILHSLRSMMWKFWYLLHIFGVTVAAKIIYKNPKLDRLLIIDVWWRTMGSFAVTDVNCEHATERVLCVGVLSFHQRWKPFKCIVR